MFNEDVEELSETGLQSKGLWVEKIIGEEPKGDITTHPPRLGDMGHDVQVPSNSTFGEEPLTPAL